MGIVVSYDEKLGLPNSEIELASGEHIFLSLDREGLVIKLLPKPDTMERILFQAGPPIVAKICDALFDIQPDRMPTPLQMLVATAVHLPNAGAVETAFRMAAKA